MDLRNMILAMVDEPLVLVVKLADRLHNMRTVFALRPRPPARRRRGDHAGLVLPGRAPGHVLAQGEPRTRCDASLGISDVQQT